MGGGQGPGRGHSGPKRVVEETTSGEAGHGPASPYFYEEQRLGLPLMRVGLRLAVEVGERGLSLRLNERLSREILFEEIQHCERREGLVISPTGFPLPLRNERQRSASRPWSPGPFYNLTSNRGVALELGGGIRVIVGSRRPGDLERAIRTGMARAGRPVE